ncbi:MAG: 30S ribosomal protein S17e [Candidatus Thorarchaeota archaeon]|jgi:small subunit ribosomal protein S17e
MLYKLSLEHTGIHRQIGELELGSVRPRYIKNAAKNLLALYPETFTDDFETNKRLVEQFTDVSSKKVRNRIAGYLVGLIKIGVARAEAEALEPGEEVTDDMEM